MALFEIKAGGRTAVPLALPWPAAHGTLLRPRRPSPLEPLRRPDLASDRHAMRPRPRLLSLGAHRSLVHSTFGDLGELLVGPLLLVEGLLQQIERALVS